MSGNPRFSTLRTVFSWGVAAVPRRECEHAAISVATSASVKQGTRRRMVSGRRTAACSRRLASSLPYPVDFIESISFAVHILRPSYTALAATLRARVSALHPLKVGAEADNHSGGTRNAARAHVPGQLRGELYGAQAGHRHVPWHRRRGASNSRLAERREWCESRIHGKDG